MEVFIHVSGPVKKQMSGAFTCRIDVELDGLRLPEAGWLDFTEILLWWVDRLEERGQRILDFMDGPFEMRLEDDDDDADTALLSFVKRTLRGDERDAYGTIRKAQFRAALKRACLEMAAFLRDEGHIDEAIRFEIAAER
jgi:hypothetical protein